MSNAFMIRLTPKTEWCWAIQGAFNEFELSMILDRMQQSLRQKAERGEQWDALPSGYVCRHPPLCEKHPDQSVQRAVQKVLNDFQCFSQRPASLLAFAGRSVFKLPVVPHGSDWRDVQWITPSYHQILELVRNPIYAGIYARGPVAKRSRCSMPRGHKHTTRHRVPAGANGTFSLENHHPAYMTRQECERNVETIAANANVRGALTKGRRRTRR